MKKHYLRLLIAAYSISTFSQGILAPIYAFFVERIGGGILETSFAVALFSIVTGVSTILIYQTKSSRIYQREFLCVGWFLWVMSVIMYFFVTNIYTLFLTEVLGALGSAISNPAYDAEYSKQTMHDLSGGWAMNEGVSTIFYGIACLSGGVIASYFGFTALLVSMTILASLSFFMILYYSLEEKSNNPCQ